jgi:hypothetical protein
MSIWGGTCVRSWTVARRVCVHATTQISSAQNRVARPANRASARTHSSRTQRLIPGGRPTLRPEILRERWRASRLPSLRSALRGLDLRHALPNLLHLSERRTGDATWHNAPDVKLRNAHLAVVDRGKVLDYLLNEAHPDNGGKAGFFVSLGFSRADPERLMKALRDVAEHGEVVNSSESVHGEKYVVDGWLSAHTQESRQWSVRTVWIIDRDGGAPRLVTAYPGKE